MKGEVIDLSAFAVGSEYSRKEIASAGGVTPPVGPRDPAWSTGIIVFDNAVLLLATLVKETYDYRDEFTDTSFYWQSQTRQSQDSPVIRDLSSGAVPGYLFARLRSKVGGQTQPFVFCGALGAPDIVGSNPVTAEFPLLERPQQPNAALRALLEWRAAHGQTLAGAERQVAMSARRIARGQGQLRDEPTRKAIELHAMARASQHYEELGYEVTDTSLFESYDLVCTRGAETRRVEVKGTTGEGITVEVTAGEVRAAQEDGVPTDLYVVYRIEVGTQAGSPVAHGGRVRMLSNWLPAAEQLIPTRFRYLLPND